MLGRRTNMLRPFSPANCWLVTDVSKCLVPSGVSISVIFVTVQTMPLASVPRDAGERPDSSTETARVPVSSRYPGDKEGISLIRLRVTRIRAYNRRSNVGLCVPSGQRTTVHQSARPIRRCGTATTVQPGRSRRPPTSDVMNRVTEPLAMAESDYLDQNDWRAQHCHGAVTEVRRAAQCHYDDW